MIGIDVICVSNLQASTFSISDMMPMSGWPSRELATPAPVVEAALNPIFSTSLALKPS